MFTAIRAETAPFTNLPTSEGRAQKEGRAVTETSESSYYRQGEFKNAINKNRAKISPASKNSTYLLTSLFFFFTAPLAPLFSFFWPKGGLWACGPAGV
jgi:hypothetical protein